MTFEDLIKRVQAWGQEKGITDPKNTDKQFLKFMEEALEFKTELDRYVDIFWDDDYSAAFVDYTRQNLLLEFGDVLVTLCILAKQLDLDPTTCLEMAYKKISKRKGKTVDGVFIKEE
ncbi:MazG nucleotide pyrophosphohydrolase domain protein [Peptoniphilus sp. oral taxon 375 str. F0436]|nr:MazG nucleotide pyrophosphohydrolase domain protein [Peptoniphilus sp. oral taxon 375 str. F0436]